MYSAAHGSTRVNLYQDSGFMLNPVQRLYYHQQMSLCLIVHRLTNAWRSRRKGCTCEMEVTTIERGLAGRLLNHLTAFLPLKTALNEFFSLGVNISTSAEKQFHSAPVIV